MKEDIMKRKLPAPMKRALAIAIAAIASGASAPVFAALTTISPTPLNSSSNTIVKPNIHFVLDTSGSMLWAHAPDDVFDFGWRTRVGYRTSQCNSIYYNPAITYDPPIKADGTSWGNVTFTDAPYDGFNPTGTKVNLNNNFRSWYDEELSNIGVSGDDSASQAYYYRYSGSATPDWVSSTSTFKTECNTSTGTTSTVFTKVSVATASAEAQNFANWYSYYRTRINMMKSGASIAFYTVPSSYRVGFSTIYQTPTSDTTDRDFLAINDFTAAQKTSWYDRIRRATPGGGTPLRTALSTAGRYYAGRYSPVFGGDVPDPVQYSCQQNFLILTTDGYWNAGSTTPRNLAGTGAVGEQDGATGVTAPFKDSGTEPRVPGPGNNTVSSISNTLADAAFYYYNTDLRQNTDSSKPGYVSDCNTGVSGADVCTNNVPKSGTEEDITKDNADWQHMTTFTLGLGTNGKLRYDFDYQKGTSADYNAILQGTRTWPNPVGDERTTTDDLWHAAVNGHGRYFSAKDPDRLVDGLRTALNEVKTREAAGAAAATSNLEPVSGDNYAFVANYRTVKWDGDVEARTIDINTGIFSTGAPIWSAQIKLNAQVTATGDTRTILTPNAAGNGLRNLDATAADLLTYFDPSTLSQYAGLDAVLEKPFATAASLIAYLRGATGNDRRASNAKRLYRERDFVLGDIINGKPVYAKKSPFNYGDTGYAGHKTSTLTRQGVVYVASNDGMLHAFNADTGVELWAYVPSFVVPSLKQLADVNYGTNHVYLTDGAPTISDVSDSAGNWKTILVAGLNAGGRGYYALDITTPATPALMWEFTHANMGLTYGNAVIGKLAGAPPQTWVVAFTSGYNNAPPNGSGDGVGRLYVLDALTGVQMSWSPISTGVGTTGTPSNLGKISAWVDSGLSDNTIRRIYGGDMLGNLWRFDINDTYTPTGRDAFKMATLRVGTTPQPITAKPELGLIDYGTTKGTVPVIYVGTGRYLGSPDVTDTSLQTLYAIRDKLDGVYIDNPRGKIRPSAAADATNCMVEQKLASLNTNTRVISTNNAVDLSATDCGFLIDLKDVANTTPGERINVDMKLQLGVLGVITNIPENTVCTVGGSSFIYFLDFAKGGTLGSFVEITDVNGVVSTTSTSKVGERVGNSTAVGMNTYRLPDGRVVTTVTTADDKHPVYGNPTYTGGGASAKRVLWRELLN